MQIVVPLTGAVAPLAQGGQVGIVAEPDRHIEIFPQDAGQGELFPPRYIGSRQHDAQLGVDPTRSRHANRANMSLSRPKFGDQADQAFQRGFPFGLGWNAFLSDGAMFSLRIYGHADLCPTDVNSDIHVHISAIIA